MCKIWRRNRNIEQTYRYCKQSNSMQRNLLIPVNTHATRICFTLNNSTSSRPKAPFKLAYISCITYRPTSKHATQPYHVLCKQFEYASRHCVISRRGMLAARLAGFHVASAEESKRDGEWAWLLRSTLGHGGEFTALVSYLSCVCCSCATDAVRRPAARLFVRDA